MLYGYKPRMINRIWWEEREANKNSIWTSIPKVLLKQYKSPSCPSKVRRDTTPTIIDQREHKSLTWSVSCGYTSIYQISSQYLKNGRECLENWILAGTITHIKVCHSQHKWNFICITSIEIHIQNFKTIFLRTAEKSLENKILAMANNSY